jgi:succinate-semialdehyde dehydrogenase / glutarate-semialdehyde dehydrogenase
MAILAWKPNQATFQFNELAIGNRQLLPEKGYIGGEWVAAKSGKTYAVTNPATGETIASMPNMDTIDTRQAVDAAEAAFPDWRSKTGKERAVVLKRWYELIIDNREDLARILTAEQGKPLAEARGEITFAASFVDWYAEEAKRINGEVLQSYSPDRRVMVLKQPIGVVGAITPWNFPSAMITRKCAPAVAVGCTVVLKPAEDTPLSCIALMVLADQAGFPKGVINAVPASAEHAPKIGAELTSNKKVRKISFTGSTAVGKILLRQSADTVKKVSLELGGNAPFIVFDDADLDRAVAGAIASKFRNMGQTCVCANRFYVQDMIYDAFAEKLIAEVSKLKVGRGWEGGVTQGPLINDDAVTKVEEHISDAQKRGARIALGGKRHDGQARFFEPTVLVDVKPGSKLCNEETFGPVAPLFRFKDEKEVVELANSSDYGLAGYFYTRDIARALRVAEALDFGAVGVNEAVLSSEAVPIGGFKESGIGREGSHHGVEGFLELKQVTIGGLR